MTGVTHKRLTTQFCASELRMNDENFATIQRVALQLTGIVLDEHNREMLHHRLAKRIRLLGMRNFDEYCQCIASLNPVELKHFINTVTINLTGFFREPHHFDFLKNLLLTNVKKSATAHKQIRIWSAGCSSGEEAYSIAICLLEVGMGPSWDVKILATDLDSSVLETADRGVYGVDRVDGMAKDRIKRWFLYETQGDNALLDSALSDSALLDNVLLKVRPEVRQLITFEQVNLLENGQPKETFDAIFCRNVMMYFNSETQQKLLSHFAGLLTNKGHLFLGHSESLSNLAYLFENCGKTIYRKR